MQNRAKPCFISKKISLALAGKQFSALPKIIRSDDIGEINTVKKMIAVAKRDLDDKKQQEIKAIEKMRVDTEKKAREEIVNKALSYFDEFESYRDKYFNSLEAHCATIVKKTMNRLLNDIDNEQRITVALQAAIKEVKGQSHIELKVNPAHEATITQLLSDRGWQIQYDASFSLDECQINVPLGGYRSGFNYSFDSLLQTLDTPQLMEAHSLVADC